MRDTQLAESYKIMGFDLSFFERLILQFPFLLYFSFDDEVNVSHELVASDDGLISVEYLLNFLLHQFLEFV